jgi:hypothetical protein
VPKKWASLTRRLAKSELPPPFTGTAEPVADLPNRLWHPLNDDLFVFLLDSAKTGNAKKNETRLNFGR